MFDISVCVRGSDGVCVCVRVCVCVFKTKFTFSSFHLVLKQDVLKIICTEKISFSKIFFSNICFLYNNIFEYLNEYILFNTIIS